MPRIFVIRSGEGAQQQVQRFVRAESRGQAMRHCKFSAKVATQQELVDWLTAGNQIEQAKDDGVLLDQQDDELPEGNY